MNLPFTAGTPDEFFKLMEMIWESPCEPAPDGGVICSVSDYYDAWHDAIRVAKKCGLVKTGPSCRDETKGYVFRWPETGAGVFISRDGSMIDKAGIPRRH